jgi:AcrR family transcriptional regulator
VSDVKRPYHAPIREEQAAQTRRRIAVAAAAEFAQRGWAATTIAAVAARAGVTPQAVHLAVGGKAAVLIRGLETAVAGSADETALADRPTLRSVYAEGVGTRRRLNAFATTTSDIYQRAARLFLVLQEAAAADPAAAELADQGAGRRLADHRRLAVLLLPHADEEAVQTLTDTIWVLAGPAVYVDFVHRRGWQPDRYVSWLSDQLAHAVRAARRSRVAHPARRSK